MNYYKRIKSFLFKVYRMQSYSGKYIKDITSVYDEEYDDLKKTKSEQEAYKTIVTEIKADNPQLVEAYKYHNLFLLIAFISSLFCIIISFCNIMAVSHCPGDSSSACTITSGSPLLTVYSIGYDFAVILPLLISLIFSVIDFLIPKKVFSIVNIIALLIPAALIPYLGWLYSFYLFPYIALIVLSVLAFLSSSLVLYESTKTTKKK